MYSEATLIMKDILVGVSVCGLIAITIWMVIKAYKDK
jgi:hypothetical protein